MTMPILKIDKLSVCAYIINHKNCSSVETKRILLDNAVKLKNMENKVANGRFLSIKNIADYIS